MSANASLGIVMYRIIFVGISNSGRSSFVLRYTDDTFSEERERFESDSTHETQVGEQKIKLVLRDTNNSHCSPMREITSSYYRGSHAVVICLDCTEKHSLSSLKDFREKIKKWSAPGTLSMVAITKIDDTKNRVLDLQDVSNEISPQDLEADGKAPKIVEISAKSGENVKAVMEEFVQRIHNHFNLEGVKETAKSDDPKCNVC
mmetsp:Transcript_16721/g.24988  ORF Transcript_16721/g.24988 Transcript_16721/m.24988 type:complete len:203 (+) Transcript_16721:88-696(+)